MNKKTLVITGVAVAVVGILTGAGFYLSNSLSISYECNVDFLYEFDRPFKNIPGRGTFNADEHNRHFGYEDITSDFKNEVVLSLLRDGASRCQRDSILQSESESRSRAVLASVRLDVIGMPSTNFVYPCRLVLTDVNSRNLCEYARFCMDRVKDQISEKNRISIAKATVKEHQRLMQAERRIEELEKAAAKGEEIPTAEKELRLARHTMEAMKTKIDEVRESIMYTGGQRIIYESQPEVSWVIRRKR